MNQEQSLNIINDHYRKLSSYIHKITENFDIEDIHIFRVEYKKLRALLRMLSVRKKVAQKLKISGKLKKYYKIAGEIRDLQLQQLRIEAATKSYKIVLPGYLNLLRKQIEKLKVGLDGIYFENTVKGFKQQSATYLPVRFPIKGLKEYVNQKWNTVHTIILYHYLSDDTIHTIRKNLKDLAYNLKEYKRVEKRVLPEAIPGGKGQAYFNQFLTELGNYHDLCVAISLLKSCYLNRLNSYNRLHLDQIKVQWKKDKRHSRQLLLNELKNQVAPPTVQLQIKPIRKPTKKLADNNQSSQ